MASKILLKIFLAVLLLKLCNGKGSSGSHQVTTTITSQGTDPVKPTSSSCSAENSFEMIIEASSVEDLKKVLEDNTELNAFIGKHMEDLAENTGDGTCGDDIALPTTGITPDSELPQTTTQRSGTDNTADQVTKFETSTSSDSLQTTIQHAEIETTEESVTTFKTTELQMSATPMPSDLTTIQQTEFQSTAESITAFRTTEPQENAVTTPQDSELLPTTTQRSGTDNTADHVTKLKTSTSSVSKLPQTTIQQTEIKTTEKSVTTFKTTELQTSASTMPTELQTSLTSIPSGSTTTQQTELQSTTESVTAFKTTNPQENAVTTPQEKMMDESFYAKGFENWTLNKSITSEQPTLLCEDNTLLYIHQACYYGSCCRRNCGCPETTKNMISICNLKQSCNMTIPDIVTKLYADCQIKVSYTCVKEGSSADELIEKGWYQASNKYWYRYDKNDEKTFSEAIEACSSSGGRLASVGIRDNNTKWELVHKYGWKRHGLPRERWVGLKKKSDNLWEWNDGIAMKKGLWKHGEPNNEGKNEDCGYIDANANWKMTDGVCTIKRPYVCESKKNIA